jgi:hypothetical protein
MALRATQDHKDSAILAGSNLKDLAESLGQILRFAQDDKSIFVCLLNSQRMSQVTKNGRALVALPPLMAWGAAAF